MYAVDYFLVSGFLQTAEDLLLSSEEHLRAARFSTVATSHKQQFQLKFIKVNENLINFNQN